MKIELLVPNGFCYGVITAYNRAMDVINNNPNKKIYMLGWIVHNQKVIDDFIQKGVIILDDKKNSRYDLVNSFKSVKNSILILSAHGTSDIVIDLAKSKGFEIVDLTCKYVYKTHDIIEKKINEKYEIIFIGKNNHPETNAIISNFKNIILEEDLLSIEKIKFDPNQKYFCTNQTTISHHDFNNIIEELKKKINKIEFANDICDATTIRQDAIIKMSPSVDICIIIGDKKSSNTDELYKLARNKTEAYKVNDVDEINIEWFKNKKHCAITAGASTPRILIEKIVNFIKGNINEN